MSEFELDAEWIFLYPIFAVGTATSLGFISADILPVVNLADVLFSVGNIEFTIGRVAAVLSLIGVLYNRDTSLFDSFGAIEGWVVYATFGLLLAPPAFSVLESTLAEGPAGIFAFVVQSIGFTIVTYLN